MPCRIAYSVALCWQSRDALTVRPVFIGDAANGGKKIPQHSCDSGSKSGLSRYSIKPGGAYVSSYPAIWTCRRMRCQFTKCITPATTTMKRRWLRWGFRMGYSVWCEAANCAEKPFVVGLNQGAKHTLTWGSVTVVMGMVWRITGLYYIHVGPPGPKAIWKTENGVKRRHRFAGLYRADRVMMRAGRFQRIVAYTCTGERTKGNTRICSTP